VSPSSVLDWLEGLQGPLPYVAVFLVAFAEHALFVGTFVPGEVILPLAGVAAATTGVMAWPAAAACATAGGLLADQLTYWLGRRLAGRPGGPGPAPASPGPGRGRLARPAAVVRELYRRHGALALVLGRFVAGVAPFVAPGAGWAGMPYRRFLPANALANVLWGPVMVGTGYLFGIQAARLHGPWRWAGLAVTVTVLALAFLRLRSIGADLARSADRRTGDVRDA
jgi:membrane protein DedA with SNARE-associated domain